MLFKHQFYYCLQSTNNKKIMFFVYFNSSGAKKKKRKKILYHPPKIDLSIFVVYCPHSGIWRLLYSQLLLYHICMSLTCIGLNSQSFNTSLRVCVGGSVCASSSFLYPYKKCKTSLTQFECRSKGCQFQLKFSCHCNLNYYWYTGFIQHQHYAQCFTKLRQIEQVQWNSLLEESEGPAQKILQSKRS